MAQKLEVLLGRDREFGQLSQVLDRACAGDAGFVVVTGEAGVGKTRLLEELARDATRRGCLTLVGRAVEFEHELPFGLFADAFDAYLASLDERLIDRLTIDRLGALSAVFPSLQALSGSVEFPVSTTERFRVHRAVRELIERLAAVQPVVLILDDAQWADGASLELLASLLHRSPQAAVMIAMTFRTGDAAHGARRTVSGLQRIGGVETVELGPLPLDVIREMIGDRPNLDVERLHHDSGGNPFFALQLARADDVPAAGGPGGRADVPPTVRRMITAELERLSPSARGLIEAAAVIGDPFDLDLAVATSDSYDDDPLDRLDELAASDLVKPTAVPRRFQFRHPLVRSAVYESTPPGARLACHRRAADALTQAGDPAVAIAVHVEQSAAYGDTGAIDTLRRAGDESIRQAPTSAARWYAAALRILPPDASPDDRVDLLKKQAACHTAVGDLGDAHVALDECVALLRRRTGSVPIEFIVERARIEQLLGRQHDARAQLELALEALVDVRSADGVALLLALSGGNFYLSDHVGMLASAERAVACADELGDPALAAAALASWALATALAGPGDKAMHARDLAARNVDALTDGVLSGHMDAFGNLAEAELYLDLFAPSRAHAERGLALARSTGRTEFSFVLSPCLGASLFMSGEIERSATVLDDAVDAALLARNAQTICWALMSRSLCALLGGDLETALARGAESVEVARSFDRGLISVFAGATYAQSLLEAGDAAAALDALLASGGGSDLRDLPGSWRGTSFEVLTRCYLRLGRGAEAAAAAACAREQAELLGTDRVRSMADRAAAEVALSDGRPEDAVDLALSALALSESIGARVYVAQSRSLVGRALLAAGRTEDAIAQLQRAASDFESMHAIRYRDQVESQLRRLGQTIHRRSRPGGAGVSGIATLTGREFEVAELVRQRRTNKQIAEELFLSIKTVETHVRNIFNKLDVTTRADIATALSRHAGAQA